MKKALLILSVVACLASCKKDKNDNKKTPGLFGTWQLTWLYGGWSPPQRVNNSGDKYQFKSDSTYTRFIDNKVTASGKFSIHIIETRDTLKFGVIKFTNPTNTEAWTETPNTIIIGTSAADGPSYQYVKISSK